MEFEQELLDEFIVEAKEHLSVVETELLELEKETESPDINRVDSLFRAIHSIKGAAGFLGLTNIGELSHVMETLLQMIRTGEILPEQRFIDGLLEGTDLLGGMFDDITNSNSVSIKETHDRINALLSNVTSPDVNIDMETVVNVFDLHENPTNFKTDKFTLNSLPDEQKFLYVLNYDLCKFQKNGGLTPATLVRRLLVEGQILDAKLDISATDLSADLSNEALFYSLLYSTRCCPNTIQEITCLPEDCIVEATISGVDITDIKEVETKDIKSETEPKETTLKEPTKISENAIKTEEQPKIQNTTESSKKSLESSETIRIQVNLLDQLMTLAGELVLVRNQQMLTLDREDPVSRGISQRLDIVTSELQETIMRTRMQPAGNVFGKLPRIVRDLSKKLGKSMTITTYGDDVELDKTILESLADPLIHIIRNSCDHGIESPEKREQSGKPETGTITVKAYHEGGQINIQIQDDGGGINADAVRKKALGNGLKTEAELSLMRDKDLHQLIMLPGFSTAEKTTDVSGRGVGMDVVRTAIEKLGGTLDLESTKGQGTSINLRLPLTLAIIPCLVVEVGEHRYSIPQVNLEELVCLHGNEVDTKIESAGTQDVYRLRDHLLPMTRLSEVLGVQMKSGNAGDQSSGSLTFAVVKNGHQRFGLIVDRVLGTEEIVVKAMHPALKSLPTYSGATVMGDGKVALILDIEGIAQHAGIVFNLDRNLPENGLNTEVDTVSDSEQVLLFNNGTEQFAVSLPLIRRIERISTSRIERVGNQEFVTIDGASTLILRLDHVLNVAPSVDEEELFLLLPKHVERPFGIVMSEIADIAKATSITGLTSYGEKGILGTAIIHDRMTLFLEIYDLIERADPNWFASRRQASPRPNRTCNVLFAEDMPFFQKLVMSYLRSDNYNVTVVDNGAKALEMLKSQKFDLLISDIEMPVMDGIELIKNVRAIEELNDLPAIALTSLSSARDKSRALDSGFNEYRIKINREGLLTTVSEVLQRHGYKNQTMSDEFGNGSELINDCDAISSDISTLLDHALV